ncbi:MAG: fibronectin type III domain-containing protein [Bacteroidales bacterium]|nr:fibronectin type III domain-containing protein [Bacteroidales bacterium]
MKRENVFFVVLLCLLMVCFSSHAQTYISEGFESANHSLPTGWTSIGPGTVSIHSSNVHGGSHSLKFTGAVSNVVMLPELSVPVNTTQVTLWTKAEGNYANCGTFQVGYLTDTTDANTFVAVENISYADYVTYNELTVPMNNAPAGARIAFRHTSAYIYYSWFCDDVTVEALPTCMPVTDLSALPGYNGVILSWSDAFNSNNYTVYNMTTGDVLAANLQTQTYTVQNLAPATSYTFGVVSICSAADTSSVVTVNTQTTCPAFTTPFSEDLEGGDMPVCWTQNGDWTWRVGTGDHYSSTGAHTGTYNFVITSDINDGTARLITPKLDLSNQSAAVHLSFWHIQRAWYGDYDKLKVLYRTSENSSWVQLANYTNPIENWTEENLVLPDVSATYQLAFEFQAGWGYGVAIDDILIDAPAACSHVMNLTATPATDSVVLAWTDTQNTGATYTVSNASSGAVLVTNYSGNTYTVSGLTPGTNYQFSVVANCSPTESSIPTTISVRTECGVLAMPFYESFNELTSGIPFCWNNSEGTTSIGSWKWNHDTTGFYGPGLKFNSYVNEEGRYNVLSTPPVTISENALLSFWCKNPDGGDLSVFASVDTSSIRDTLITNLTDIDDWMHVGLPLDSATYMGHDITIYFQGTSNYGHNDAYIYLDEVAIVSILNPLPDCMSVDQLRVDSVSATSVSLSWVSDAPSFTVMNDTVLVATGITDTHFTVTGLTTATHYTFSVIANCTDSIFSEEVSVDAFTSCPAFGIPYVENFEADGQYDCWTVHATNSLTGRTDLTVFAENGNGFFAFASSVNPPQYLISPELSGTDDGLRFSFGYKAIDYRFAESFVVGYSTTTNDTNAFVWGTEVTDITNSTYIHYVEEMAVSDIKYVAIKHTSYDMSSLLIDSLVIRRISSCLPATNLSVEDIGATSVTLSWDNPDNVEGSFSVIYFNEQDMVVDTTGFTGTSYTVEGLTPSTQYRFMIRTDCEDTVAYSDPVIVVTQSQQAISTFDGTSKWRLYPNPANTTVTIEAEGMRNVIIFDATGREVMRSDVNNDMEHFDVSGLENGVYFFRIEAADRMTVRKCVVNH